MGERIVVAGPEALRCSAAVLRRRYMEAELPGSRIGLRGEIRSIEVVHAPSGIVRRKLGPYRNLMTDAGFNAIGNGTPLNTGFTWLGVGTGNAAPANSQTSLGAQVGARVNANGGFGDTVASGPDFTYWERTRTRVFAAGAVDGVALAELGFFTAATGGTMYMRQLIRDDLGSPTTITLAADEELRVVYAWRLYTQQDSAVANITIEGVDTAITTRGQLVNDAGLWGNSGLLENLGRWHTGNQNCARATESNTLPNVTAEIAGTPGDSLDTVAFAAYTNGTFYRDMLITVPPAKGNYGTGLGGIKFLLPRSTATTSNNPFVAVFAPKVPKTNTKQFVLTQRITWARV